MFTKPSNSFAPPDVDIPGILDDLASSIYTMADIASRYNATIEDLARWMARPDIAARIDAFESAIARRARLQATATLANALSAAARILADFESESAHIPVNPKSIRALEQRTRAAAVARAAASLITRIARSSASTLPRATAGRSVLAQVCSAGVQLPPFAQAHTRTSWDLKLPLDAAAQARPLHPSPSHTTHVLPSPASGDERSEGRSVLASPSKAAPSRTAPWADAHAQTTAAFVDRLLHNVGLTISAHQRAPP